ncbi:hypothetical protein ES288_A13G125000v1 [Gossypium darwinii]|uniref:GDSL esterase/lipase n=1 Tax=Gossypium darwinii TaxID=34276 RepID=A0A5D2DZ19_GOSDA|nr:hypothetical protein ES288_A13G125000v1 [Gossypium darwinii]
MASSASLMVLALLMASIAAIAEARAFFIFGDSLVDSGNNNYLETTARADSPPYGIDYPTGRPTGRFSNGLNIPDLIGKQIGLSESPLPYLSPDFNGKKLLLGANFASAGVGILNDTGVQFVNILRMYRQLELFEEYKRRLSGLVGTRQANRVVSQALVLITVGGNDFVNNYYLVPFSARSRQYSTGPLGCVPAELAMRGNNGGCSQELQRAASLYNPQLVQMINGLNAKIGRDVFISANTQKMHNDFVSDPQAFGFTTSEIACCGQGPYNGLGLCTQLSNLCPNRDLYTFWDPFHPSEKANRLIVEQIMRGSNEYMNPTNLSTIIAFDSKM